MRLALSLTILLLVGCTHHVRIDNPYFRPADRHKTWVNGFLWNLVGGRVNAADFCGDRPVAAIDTRRSFGNALVSWLTLGIYTPMHATITCGEIRYQASGYGPQPVIVQPPPAVYAAPPAYLPAPPPAAAPIPSPPSR